MINVKEPHRRAREGLTTEGHRIFLTGESGDGGDEPEFGQCLDPARGITLY